MSATLEIAWAAGFFDGEGWVGITTTHSGPDERSYIYVAASISQNHRAPLERFRDAVGEGKIYGPHSNVTPYQWSARGTSALRAMDVIVPYLSSIKSEQWRTAVAKYESDLAERPRDGAREFYKHPGSPAIAPHTLNCSHCATRKPIQDFVVQPRNAGRGGRASWCRRCTYDHISKKRREQRRAHLSPPPKEHDVSAA